MEHIFPLNKYLLLPWTLDAGDTIWCVDKDKDPQAIMHGLEREAGSEVDFQL